MDLMESQLCMVKLECARLGLDLQHVSRTAPCSPEEAYRLRVEGLLQARKLADLERDMNQKLDAKDREIQLLRDMVSDQEKQLQENKKEINALKAEATEPRTLQELMMESRKTGTQNVHVGGSPSTCLPSSSKKKRTSKKSLIKPSPQIPPRPAQCGPISSGRRSSPPSPPSKQQASKGEYTGTYSYVPRSPSSPSASEEEDVGGSPSTPLPSSSKEKQTAQKSLIKPAPETQPRQVQNPLISSGKRYTSPSPLGRKRQAGIESWSSSSSSSPSPPRPPQMGPAPRKRLATRSAFKASPSIHSRKH